MLLEEANAPHWKLDDQLGNHDLDLQLQYVLYEFLARNFKSSDGKLNVNKASSLEECMALLNGLGEQYNSIIGTDPNTGIEITITIDKNYLSGNTVATYYPTFGPGMFETCLVMRLKGVTEYTVPAFLTNFDGESSPHEGRWGNARRDFVKALLRVGIPNITMEDNNYEYLHLEKLQTQFLTEDAQLSRICEASSHAFNQLNESAGKAFPIRLFDCLGSVQDKSFCLDVLFPQTTPEFRQICLKERNLNKAIEQCYYVPSLLLKANFFAAHPQQEKGEALVVGHYCGALELSLTDRKLQTDACQGLFYFRNQLAQSPEACKILLRTLCQVIAHLDVYNIEMLKEHLLRPFELKELFSKDACHRPKPWRVEGFAPRFFMSVLHKVESVIRVYSADTAMAYLSIVVTENFDQMKQDFQNNVPALQPVKELLAAIQRNESPLPLYLRNEPLFLDRARQLTELMVPAHEEPPAPN
jgi:hypothetical protein